MWSFWLFSLTLLCCVSQIQKMGLQQRDIPMFSTLMDLVKEARELAEQGQWKVQSIATASHSHAAALPEMDNNDQATRTDTTEILLVQNHLYLLQILKVQCVQWSLDLQSSVTKNLLQAGQEYSFNQRSETTGPNNTMIWSSPQKWCTNHYICWARFSINEALSV